MGKRKNGGCECRRDRRSREEGVCVRLCVWESAYAAGNCEGSRKGRYGLREKEELWGGLCGKEEDGGPRGGTGSIRGPRRTRQPPPPAPRQAEAAVAAALRWAGEVEVLGDEGGGMPAAAAAAAGARQAQAV